MIWSLNEIDATCRKAARGAGFSWGMAEEAGKATRWLSERGQAGPDLLARLLLRNDRTPYADLVPATTDGVWVAAGGTLCPLIAGAALCDRAADLWNGRAVTLSRTAFPLLLAPFADAIAHPRNLCVTLNWDDVTLSLTPNGVLVSGNAAAMQVEETEKVSITANSQPVGTPLTGQQGRDVGQKTADILNAFAHRTYAPATEESRVAGAGAGTTDND